MRIVLDLQACQTSGSKNRGIGRYTMALSQAMARQARGHEIVIALNGAFPDTIAPLHQAFDSLVGKDNIRVFQSLSPLAELDAANFWRTRAAERIREQYLSTLSADFVFVSSLFEGLGDDAVTSIGHLPTAHATAVTLYDLIPLLNRDIYLKDARVRDWYFRKLLSLKKADLLLSISDYSRREAIDALQLAEDQVVNMSSAVDTIFHPHVLSIEEAASLNQRYGLSKPFIMYTGGIDHRKNIEGLIEAYAMLPGEIRAGHQLAIVCSMDEHNRRRLESLIAKFSLTKQDVLLTGFVPEVDLAALYNACALFVFPSLHEGFGLPVLEAMWCGAAVIGSNTSSIPEVIGREDALFDPRDLSAIAGKMHAVLTDEGFKTALQKHGAQQAKKFSWDASAQRAWEALEQRQERRQQQTRIAVPVGQSQARPRLAYVSPLPPDKSGIADYSAELLPELARHYDIDVISPQQNVSDPWIAANFPVRSIDWFDAHAAGYDRVLYQFGNSSFHQHMFDLLARHPGVVVLHDFFMSGLLEYAERVGVIASGFTRALYESHGYAALIDYVKLGADPTQTKYPCNQSVVDQALGVIVHSAFSIQLAKTWYGEQYGNDWQHIPQIRLLPGAFDRTAARKQLGLDEDDFLVCSFGFTAPTKLNHVLVEAWKNSPLARDKRCHLVFVGENHGGEYGRELELTIAAAGGVNPVRITGFITAEQYKTYLEAADAAVQLRTQTRGETSRAILDCLAYGIPTIINAHGSSADLPANVAIKITDTFSAEELGEALTASWDKRAANRQIGQRAAAYMRREHHPVQIGDRYFQAIESFSEQGQRAKALRLIHSLGQIASPVAPTAQDLAAAAASIAANQPTQASRKVYLDVSALMQAEPAADASQPALAMLNTLLALPARDFRVEPVYLTGERFKYAREFTLNLLGVRTGQLDDEPIDPAAGDVFFGMHPSAAQLHAFAAMQAQGFPAFSLTAQSLRSQHACKGVDPRFIEWLAAIDNAAELACLSCSTENTAAELAATTAPMLRDLARKRLQLAQIDILICALCSQSLHQAVEKFLRAWLDSPLAQDSHYRLVLLGESSAALADLIGKHDARDRIQFAGALAPDMLHSCLISANVVLDLQQEADPVQVDAIFDCVAYGIPLITKLGEGTLKAWANSLCRLPHPFPALESDATTQTTEQPAISPVAEMFHNYLAHIVGRRQQESLHNTAIKPQLGFDGDFHAGLRQLCVDISFVVKTNLNSGIQRVVRQVLMELLAAPPKGFRIEPVYDAGGHYAYARRFMAQLAGESGEEIDDAPIEIRSGDIFLGLDLSPDSIRENQQALLDFKAHGMQLYFVVYDLLPVLHPQFFPKAAQATFVDWLDTILKLADGLVGISRTVADEIAGWLAERQVARSQPLHVGYFHLGVEGGKTEPAPPAKTRPARPSFLMVGTVEPRKGHAQALGAFEKLWQMGIDAELVIVGRQGWMMEALVAKLRSHPENGKRLFWFENANDALLQELYRHCSALLAASQGEGFGLPLVEAARYRMPIIARDLPVFREIAHQHAFYFDDESPESLAQALRQWLALYAEGRIPTSIDLPWLTWAESTGQLVDVIAGENWYRTV